MEKYFTLTEEKQATIRNAALSCFAKHGYEKASVNDIAVAAGISKASVFQYFGTKFAGDYDCTTIRQVYICLKKRYYKYG